MAAAAQREAAAKRRRNTLTITPESSQPANHRPQLPAPFDRIVKPKQTDERSTLAARHAALHEGRDKRWPTRDLIKTYHATLPRPRSIEGEFFERGESIAMVRTWASPSSLFSGIAQKWLELHEGRFFVVARHDYSVNSFATERGQIIGETLIRKVTFNRLLALIANRQVNFETTLAPPVR
jgi:hypothetical protein